MGSNNLLCGLFHTSTIHDSAGVDSFQLQTSTLQYIIHIHGIIIIIIISLFWKHKQSENTEKQYEQ